MSATDAAHPTAAGPAAPAGRATDDRRVRPLVTPEGVDLRLVLGSAGQRAAAFLIDVAILVGAVVAVTVVSFLAFLATGRTRDPISGQVMAIVWTLGFFVLRNGYFLGFELSPRAATPGKRMVGLRVASRDGARLTADAVFARNAMREVELFLPLGFMGLATGEQQPLLALSGLGWTLGLLLLPLLNRDRLRGGDLIAGTWVVQAPRRALRRDMAAAGEALAPRFAFTAAQLDAYGERELQVLEEVLRRGQRETVKEVAARIRTKIDWTPLPDEGDLQFLDAFYAAERRKLEGDLLFGRRRRHKNDRR